MKDKVVVPCCRYVADPENYPVYYNPYNNVVQCHNCGEQYVPASKVTFLISQIEKIKVDNDKHLEDSVAIHCNEVLMYEAKWWKEKQHSAFE